MLRPHRILIECTWRDLGGGFWRLSGRHGRPRRLHLTGGLAVVELDAVQGSEALWAGLVGAVTDLKEQPVGVEVDLTLPPLLVTLRGEVSQVPDVLSVTVRVLCEDLDGLYSSKGLKLCCQNAGWWVVNW